MIERAFIATGMDPDMINDPAMAGDLGFIFEASVVTREIGWRLRDVARDLSLNTASFDPRETSFVDRFIDTIDAQTPDGPQ